MKYAPLFKGHPGDATLYTFLMIMTLRVNISQLQNIGKLLRLKTNLLPSRR